MSKRILKAGWTKHPLSKWVGQTTGCYIWTLSLFRDLLQEYRTRFYKTHSYEKYVESYQSAGHYSKIPNGPRPEFYNCTIFKEDFGEQVVNLYKYHLNFKWLNAKYWPKWTKRGKPDWCYEKSNTFDVRLNSSLYEQIAGIKV